MKTLLHLTAAFAIATCAVLGPATAQDLTISQRGARLAQVLDRTDVEHKWTAGIHVDWQTGLPDGRPELSPGQHTHCSAFVASVAQTLGVYILRPPEHGEVLLANAQNEWLAEEGRFDGWRPVRGPVEAQMAANAGALVIASYHNHYSDKSGHIAIIRPSRKPVERVLQEGPDAIMAGTINSISISVRDGFAGHPAAWGKSEIRYYAHDLKAPLNSAAN